MAKEKAIRENQIHIQSAKLESLAQNVLNHDTAEEQALKEASDIFSGHPQNIKRLLHLYSDRLNGNGHTVFSAEGRGGKLSAAEQQKQAIRQQCLRLLQMLEDNRRFIEYIAQKQTEIHQALRAINTWSVENEKRYEEIKTLIDECLEKGLISQDDREILKEIKSNYKSFGPELKDQLIEEYQKLGILYTDLGIQIGGIDGDAKNFFQNLVAQAKDMAIIKMDIEGQQQKHFALFKDEQGYYIKHPESGERIAVDTEKAERLLSTGRKLGNDISPERIENFNAKYKEMLAYCEAKDISEEQRDAIGATLAKIEESQIAIQKLQNLQARFDAERDALRAELKEAAAEAKRTGQPIPSDTFGPRLFAIAEMYKELKAQKNYTYQLVHKNDAIISEGLKTFEEVKAQLDKARKTVEQANKALEYHGGRHGQLKRLYGNWASTIGEKLPTGAASWLANTWLGQKMVSDELAYAWKHNRVKTSDGQDVYRDNEGKKGLYYTYDKETGKRTYITDVDEIEKIHRAAYVQGKLFMNETIYSADPNNTFEQTMDDLKLTTKKIREQAEENMIKPAKEKLEKVQKGDLSANEENRPERLTSRFKDLAADWTINRSALQASFTAAHDPNQTRPLDNTQIIPTSTRTLQSGASADNTA
ncbi:MAG: hypothetical protein KDI46_00675 [Alphaproteobacteria bacterium]|nr:hypothetical protein [Alphaproteobacteria bacterium]